MEYGINDKYRKNPSQPNIKTKTDLSKLNDTDKRVYIEEGTGKKKHIVEEFNVVEAAEQISDKTPHIKVYTYFWVYELGKSGLKVMHYLMKKLPFNDDKVIITIEDICLKEEVSYKTAQRGLKELLDHKILFKSMVSNVYWLNIGVMYRGNRRYLQFKANEL